MSRWTSFLAGFGAGAAAVYFLDPDRGSARRSAVAGTAGRAVRATGARLKQGSSGMQGGWHGVRAGWRAFWQELPVADEVLVARIRAGMGHLLRDLSGLEIVAHKGHVVLSGAVDPDEVEQIVRAASTVAGVRSVENHLELRH